MLFCMVQHVAHLEQKLIYTCYTYMKNYRVATVVVTLFLVIYTVLHVSGAPEQLLAAMFLISPLMVGWMVYTVLRYAPYQAEERNDEIPDDALRGN